MPMATLFRWMLLSQPTLRSTLPLPAPDTEIIMAPELRALFSPPLLQRNLFVAVVVGTILNLINQLDFLLAGNVDLTKLALTYCVPFCVASYGSYNGLRAIALRRHDG